MLGKIIEVLVRKSRGFLHLFCSFFSVDLDLETYLLLWILYRRGLEVILMVKNEE